jgi:type VI secretion system protein ImpA
MPPFDIAAVVAPISDDEPAGPNLEFDADFGALERAAQGKPEQQFGNTIIPAEEPDWKEVEAQAIALLDRTRDLRVLAHLAVARLYLGGLPAYAEVLAAIRALLDAQWGSVHPQLDPEDDNDPTLRANALLRIAQPGWVLRHLRGLPLARSARLGQYSWRDTAIATGALDIDTEEEKPSESTIRAAFQDSDPARLAALRDAAIGAADAAVGIGAVFDSNAGYGTGPDLGDLIKLLREIARTIERYAIFDTAGDAATAPPPADDATALSSAAAATDAAPRPGGVSAATLTEVTTRADALRLLDLVCGYYRRYEPSSPLPLLIERARRLAEKDFLDILRDLAPDGVMQAQAIIGSRDE